MEEEVRLEDFRQPAMHRKVKDIVFRGNKNGRDFYLGFTPGAEFQYHIVPSPDVYFQDLSIKEVYYEPYRTFLRLKKETTVTIQYSGSPSDKLYITGRKSLKK
jgi:hypothetical protein